MAYDSFSLEDAARKWSARGVIRHTECEASRRLVRRQIESRITTAVAHRFCVLTRSARWYPHSQPARPFVGRSRA
jgi:hypothetical protein